MRSRNPATAILAGALLLAGCSAGDLNILVLSARSPGDDCDFKDDSLYVSRGSLDMRPYTEGTSTFVTTRYYQVFSWQNNLQPNPISVGGSTVDPGTGNTFIAETAVYEYQYSDPNVTLATESANMHAVITAGGTAEDNSVPADLIQPQAAAAIEGSTAIDSSNQTLLVTFQLLGRLAAGGSKYTNKVTFPLTIYRSSTTPLDCAAGGLILNTGVCGFAGRDQPVSCTTP